MTPTIDHNLFLELNFDGGGFCDAFFWVMSGYWNVILFCIIALYLVCRRLGWRQMIVALCFMILMIVVADQIANFFKNNMSRLRPTHTLELYGLIHTVKGYEGGLYGTVSAHAATVFSIFVLTTSLIRSRIYTVIALIWTLSVCYSRIYLGVHFPLDILYGTIDGIAMGLIAVWVCRKTIELMKL